MGFDALSPWHLLILAGVIVLLFGAKKLPDSARSLGHAMRIFKTEVKGLHDEDEKAPETGGTAAGQQQLPASATTPAVTPVDDGTTVNGKPLSEAQRGSQPG